MPAGVGPVRCNAEPYQPAALGAARPKSSGVSRVATMRVSDPARSSTFRVTEFSGFGLTPLDTSPRDGAIAAHRRQRAGSLRSGRTPLRVDASSHPAGGCPSSARHPCRRAGRGAWGTLTPGRSVHPPRTRAPMVSRSDSRCASLAAHRTTGAAVAHPHRSLPRS